MIDRVTQVRRILNHTAETYSRVVLDTQRSAPSNGSRFLGVDPKCLQLCEHQLRLTEAVEQCRCIRLSFVRCSNPPHALVVLEKRRATFVLRPGSFQASAISPRRLNFSACSGKPDCSRVHFLLCLVLTH
jgi:hypothetical protein